MSLAAGTTQRVRREGPVDGPSAAQRQQTRVFAADFREVSCLFRPCSHPGRSHLGPGRVRGQVEGGAAARGYPARRCPTRTQCACARSPTRLRRTTTSCYRVLSRLRTRPVPPGPRHGQARQATQASRTRHARRTRPADKSRPASRTGRRAGARGRAGPARPAGPAGRTGPAPGPGSARRTASRNPWCVAWAVRAGAGGNAGRVAAAAADLELGHRPGPGPDPAPGPDARGRPAASAAPGGGLPASVRRH